MPALSLLLFGGALEFDSYEDGEKNPQPQTQPGRIRVEDFDLADVPSRDLLAELERRLR